MDAIERLETAWFLNPEREEDLRRLHVVRVQVWTRRVPLGELEWLKEKLGG